MKNVFLTVMMAIFVVAPVQAQVFHDADVSEDNRIELSELLRVIQFFNSDGYHYCPTEGTEDGFCPGQSDIVMVPVLLGLTEAQARTSLELLGFQTSVTHECHDYVAPGMVFACSPGQGQEVEAGVTVQIWVSTGPCSSEGEGEGECEAPQITVQPQSVEAMVGETVTLDVEATGTPTLMYSWHRIEDGLSLGPIDASPLSVGVTSQTQTWYAVVSNDCGELGSQSVTVTGVESGEGEGEGEGELLPCEEVYLNEYTLFSTEIDGTQSHGVIFGSDLESLANCADLVLFSVTEHPDGDGGTYEAYYVKPNFGDEAYSPIVDGTWDISFAPDSNAVRLELYLVRSDTVVEMCGQTPCINRPPALTDGAGNEVAPLAHLTIPIQ